MPKRLDGKTFECPVQGCCGKASSAWGMCRHFALRHPFDEVVPDGEVYCGKCKNCDMQTTPHAWLMIHAQSDTCHKMGETQRQHLRCSEVTRAQRREFVISGDTLRRAESFKYLGRWLGEDDQDGPAVRAQLVKARAVWARVSNVLRSKNASPCISSMFYKALVQAILLYGS